MTTRDKRTKDANTGTGAGPAVIRIRRRNVTLAGLGAGAIGLVAVATVALWPSDSTPDPTAPSGTGTPGPSSSISPSSAITDPRDVRSGEPIPWDEVGPGWTLLVYDSEQEETEWGSDWSLAGDELWLLSPGGDLHFGAEVSDIEATFIPSWTGREVWFHEVTDVETEAAIGTWRSMDLTTGDISIRGEEVPAPGKYEPTAEEGVYLTRGGCCACTEITVHYADVTTLLLNDGCGEANLSPDGRSLAYVSTRIDDNESYWAVISVSDLWGESRPVVEFPASGVMLDLIWLDDETLLVDSIEHEGVAVLSTLDVSTGATAPWPGAQPEDYYLSMWSSYPGSWLIWTSYQPVVTTRVTDREGAVVADLGCDYPSCWPYPTGDLLLWEESDITYEDGVPIGDDLQRLTLIDPATGERIPVLEFTREDGHITRILPHPPSYG